MSEERRQDENLSALAESRIENAVAEILASANFPEIWNRINDHHKAIYGNGRPGLVETVAQFGPMVKKFEDHIVSFNKFELDMRVDRQATRDSIVAIKLDVSRLAGRLESGFKDLAKEMEPLKSLAENFTKVSVAIAFLAAIGGGLLVAFAWVVENWDRVKAWFNHG